MLLLNSEDGTLVPKQVALGIVCFMVCVCVCEFFFI
jgi:hypothetical protein